jgi:hypothetical protein
LTEKPDDMRLELVEWEGKPHCLYLNEYRIAGGKPWGGGITIKSWTISRAELLRAIKDN